LVAPSLLYFEVANALYQYHKHDILSKDAILLALQAAQSLPIQLHHPPQLHQQAIELAQQHGLPAAYDAHYLALADMISAELWTADLRLFNLVAGTLTWVHPVT
jgi:predicted nucleic acid-binding protein